MILGIAGFFTFLFLMTNPGTFRGRYNVLTQVDNAQGVRNGDPVRIRGINIGSVERAQLDGEGVLITLEIEGEWRIPRGSRIEMYSEGVLGGMVVSIVPGEGQGFVEPMELIPGETSPDLLASAGGIAVDAELILGQMRRLLNDSSVIAAGEAVAHLRDALGDLAALTAGQATQVRTLMESLRRSAENMEGITGADEWKNTFASADAALAALDRTSGEMEKAVASLNTILGRMERGEGTLGRLSADDSMYEEVEATVRSLRDLLTDIKANPGRYLKIEVF